jgi:CRP/FNR family transcriptional regulator, cyclic AMP receptor protein
VKAGQFLYQAGDDPDGLYGLAEGGLDVSFPLISDEPVVIYRTEIGFWIGDSAELAGRTRMVEHWQSFYALSAHNVESALTLLSEALALTVRARVCRRMLALTHRNPDVQITQDDLAKLVGVTRATLRRCIVDLAAEGAVETGYRTLKVRDATVLARYQDEQ